MPHIYLGNWRDGGAQGLLIPNSAGIRCSSLSVAPNRPAFFAYDEDPGLAPEFLLNLGQDLGRRLNIAERSAINIAFGITLPTNIRLAEAIESIFVDNSDVSEQTRWKPLFGDPVRGFGCWLGSTYLSFVGTEQLILVMETFRREYRKLRPQVQDQRELDVLRKWTNIERTRWGIAASDLLPPEYVDDGELRASTTFTDDFEDAAIGAEWTQDIGTWGESGGNLQQTVDDEALDLIRASGAGLSGADYHAEVQLTGTGGGSYNQYAGVRLASAGNGYLGGISSANSTPWIRLYTANALSTTLGNGGTRNTAWYYQLAISGTNLELFGGASQNPTTSQCTGSDGTYSTGDTGIVASGNFGTRTFGWFQADDGAAAGATFSASAVSLTLTPAAASFQQVFLASPVQATLTPAAATFQQVFKAAPVVMQLTPAAPSFAQVMAAQPLQLTLTPAGASFTVGKIFQASPVVMQLAPVTPGFAQRLRASSVIVEISVTAASFGQAVAASPVLLVLTAVSGTGANIEAISPYVVVKEIINLGDSRRIERLEDSREIEDLGDQREIVALR